MAGKPAPVSADEDEIKLGLCGTLEERIAALRALWDECAEDVMSSVEYYFPGLPPESGKDIVAEAFAELIEKLDSEASVWDKPLKPLFVTIARRRAIDALRAWNCRALGKADFYDFVSEEISQTKISQTWARHVHNAQANEIFRLFCAFVVTLEGHQRVIGQIMADNLPKRLEHEEIIDEVQRRVGKRLTVASIKSVLRELRKKFRELLNR